MHVCNDIPSKRHRRLRLALWRGRRGKLLIAESEHPPNQVPFDHGAARLFLSQRPSKKWLVHRGMLIRPIWSRMERSRRRPLLAHALLAKLFPLECFCSSSNLGPNDLVDLRLQNVFDNANSSEANFK